MVALWVGCQRQPAPPPPTPTAPTLATVRFDSTPLDWSRPLPAGTVAEAGYAGSAACQHCHAELYASFSRHSMARSGLRQIATLDRRWLARIFDGAPAVRHAPSGFSYRPLRRGERYFIEERVDDADGHRVQSQLRPLTHALSAGSYGMAFYFRSGGRLYQAPLDYYAAAARWDLDPGLVGGNPRFSKPLRTFCISCHADYPLRRAGTDQSFVDPLPTGIGCERCHGPGARHAATQRKSDIVNPARLPAARQLDVCAQCHLSSHQQLRAGRGEFDFRPGGVLDEVRVNFVAATPAPERLELLAHSERLLRSECWRRSDGKMTCTTCHDPHRSSFEQPASWWDGKCQSCHQQKRCSADAATRAQKGDHCARCHMRAGPPWNPTLVTTTDHWIQRRPPPLDTSRPPPAPLIPWSALLGEARRGDDLPALATLALAEAGRADEAETRAVSIVDSAPRVPEFYDWLALRFMRAGRPASAIGAWSAALRLAPDNRGALLGFARATLDSPSGSGPAMQALERLIALDPDDADALETAGVYLFRAGRVAEAMQRFARAAECGPSAAAPHVALAVMAERAGRADEAVRELEAARAIEPADAWILDKLAAAYTHDAAHAEEIARAKKYFLDGKRGVTAATAWLPPAYR